ncbi:MAG: DUF234 domain-containing protein [Spirochaetales bacterium]|nr:DUF234 domain-containing protein [Spirochaetales bacterium]
MLPPIFPNRRKYELIGAERSALSSCEELSSDMGGIFEKICTECLVRITKAEKFSFILHAIGRWWGGKERPISTSSPSKRTMSRPSSLHARAKPNRPASLSTTTSSARPPSSRSRPAALPPSSAQAGIPMRSKSRSPLKE